MIDIVFTFDENWLCQAGVCIASLIASRGREHYKIYCVANIDNEAKSLLRDIVLADRESCISFITPCSGFSVGQMNMNIKHTTEATYYRLMLPELLPNLDKVIYSDVDVIFKQDLCDVWEIPLDGKLFAAVRDALLNISEYRRGGNEELFLDIAADREYTYGGFMVMNLKKMREEEICEKWKNMAASARYFYQDQDILNLTSRGSKIFLPLKYCVIPQMVVDKYIRSVEFGIYSQAEVDEASAHPAIIHYCGAIKPWHYDRNSGGGMLGFSDFWYYAEMTPFYDMLKQDYEKNKLKYRAMGMALKFCR